MATKYSLLIFLVAVTLTTFSIAENELLTEDFATKIENIYNPDTPAESEGERVPEARPCLPWLGMPGSCPTVKDRRRDRKNSPAPAPAPAPSLYDSEGDLIWGTKDVYIRVGVGGVI